MYNTIPNKSFDWDYGSDFCLPMVNNPIVYHIHLPTYVQKDCMLSFAKPIPIGIDW